MAKFDRKAVKAFSREFDKCEQKTGAGKLEIDVECIRNAIRENPKGAKGYVEMYCVAAQTQPRYLKLAAVVAVGCLHVTGDKKPLDRVTKLAKGLGAEKYIENIEFKYPDSGAEAQGGTSGRLIDAMLKQRRPTNPKNLNLRSPTILLSRDTDEILTRAFNLMQEARTLIIDDVTNFFFSELVQEDWDYVNDFPRVTPPYPLVFLETKRPELLVSEKTGVSDPEGLPLRWGVLVEAISPDADGNRERLDAIAKGFDFDDPATKSLLALNFIIEKEIGDYQSPAVTWCFPLDAAGNIIRTYRASVNAEAFLVQQTDEWKALEWMLIRLSFPALLALSYLNNNEAKLLPANVQGSSTLSPHEEIKVTRE